MHELSIAYSLVELASAAAAEAGVAHISVVHLRLGALAGVVRDALEFGFEIAAADTPLAGARLAIEELPVQIYCPSCDAPATLPDVRQFCCPRCGTPTARIVQGRELELVALEYEETAERLNV
ncbi:MAG: hydrogenase maturation nickel metallochaperone HypA [Kouleothrix sp.]|nr:hydrogenase maturation nickel metallochaperone HypA [Kouleothrix sp.]